MWKRIYSAFIVLIFLILLIFAASIKQEYKIDNFKKIEDIEVAETKEVVPEENTSQVNIEELETQLNIINKKYDILTKIIPATGYEDSMNNLKLEIDNLNKTIQDGKNKISDVNDIYDNIQQNLNVINNGLNELIFAFSDFENSNILCGYVTTTSDTYIVIKDANNIDHKINLNNTTFDGAYNVNSNVIAVCDKDYNAEDANCDLLIVR